MKYIKYLLLFLSVNSEKIIKNINIPSCKKCIHYKPETYNFDFTSKYNKCENFGEKDIITNKIKYDFAEICRSTESKCGNNGKYFEEEQNLDMKIFIHKLSYIFNVTLPISTVIILYLFILTLPPIKN